MRLNPVVFKKLPFEIQVLWQASKKQRLSSRYLNDVSSIVSRLRNTMKSSNLDQLAMKLTEHGNQGGWANYQIRELNEAMYEDKKPDQSHIGKMVSVEIECVMPSKKAEKSVIKVIRSNGWGKFVTFKEDGSIQVKGDDGAYCDEGCDGDDCQCESNSDAFGREIVITFKYGEWTMLQTICDALNRAGATVNDSCGLHVHFDMRHMANGKKMSILAHRLGKTVLALKQLLPKSRQNNRFCKTVINKLSDKDYGDARYAFVNMKSYSKHKTLEIRGHSGTTDGVKIVNWIRILNTVMSKPIGKKIDTIEGLVSKVNFESDLILYMAERQAKFRKTSASIVGIDDVSHDNADAEIGQLNMNSTTEYFSGNVVPIEYERLVATAWSNIAISVDVNGVYVAVPVTGQVA